MHQTKQKKVVSFEARKRDAPFLAPAANKYQKPEDGDWKQGNKSCELKAEEEEEEEEEIDQKMEPV